MLVDLLATAISAGTPIALCVVGVVIAERCGVLNLGQEGIMLMGAVVSFIVVVETGSYLWAVITALTVGGCMGVAFSILTLFLQCNAVATGLAITIFSTGLSAFLGENYVGESIEGLSTVLPETLSTLPVIGPVLLGHDILLYFGLLLCGVAYYVLHRSRLGLAIRAVGENPATAHRLGISVIKIRSVATICGSSMAALGGAYLALVYTPLWTEGMTAGRGWIALALVVLAGWRVGIALLAAYGFGLISISNLILQSTGMNIAVNLLATLPYLLCLVALVIASRSNSPAHREPPRSLGQTYIKEN